MAYVYADGDSRADGSFRDIASPLSQMAALAALHFPVRTTGWSFLPGETQTLSFTPSPGRGPSGLVSMAARPTMVIFEDNTAIGPPEDINTVFAFRRDGADDRQQLVRPRPARYPDPRAR